MKGCACHSTIVKSMVSIVRTPKNRCKKSKSAPVFAQSTAPDRCRNPRFLLQQALDRHAKTGDEYISKCRRASCSIQCNHNHASKLFKCLERRFNELPVDYLWYRGNLQMPKSATPDDHKRVKKVFLQNLRRAKAKNGHVLEVFAQRHSTTIHDAHWDITVYTDMPKTVAKATILDAWKRAGGAHKSAVPVPRDEVLGWLKYKCKLDVFGEDDDSDDCDDTPQTDPRLIPAPRSVCPLESYWSTKGFWGGRKIEDYWQDFLDDLFPERVERRAKADCGSNTHITLIPSKSVPETPPIGSPDHPEFSVPIAEKLYLEDLESHDDLTAFQCEVLKQYQALRRDPERDSHNLHQSLPDSPVDALGADRIAARWGWDVDYTKGLLEGLASQGRVVQTDGQLVNGISVHNTWVRRTS